MNRVQIDEKKIEVESIEEALRLFCSQFGEKSLRCSAEVDKNVMFWGVEGNIVLELNLED